MDTFKYASELNKFSTALRKAEVAADGGSNDDHIEALEDALSVAEAIFHRLQEFMELLSSTYDLSRRVIYTHALNLQPGDYLDVEGWYDDEPLAEFEYATVAGVEQESPDWVRIDFDNFPSYGWPRDIRIAALRKVQDD